MNIGNIVNHVKATIKVEVEGYFVERFINLCRLNCINIWRVQTISAGKIVFLTTPKEVKKMETYLARTKCKLSIVKKQGFYYTVLKYKKRRVALIAFVLIAAIIYSLSTFIWNIDIYGNSAISSNIILEKLANIKVYKGKSKIGISESKISDYIRSEIYEAAWVGVKVDGTTLKIQVVEKVISNDIEENKKLGDIVARKDAVITKIVANSGTVKYKLGSFIQKGDVAIEGKIYINNEVYSTVRASGILRGKTTYNYEKEYNFNQIIKGYTGKKRYGITLGINNKKINIKCLPKDNIYDISSKEKIVNIFGIKFVIAFNTYSEYIEQDIAYDKEQLLDFAKRDEQIYLDGLRASGKTYEIEQILVEELSDKIIYKGIYSVEEDIGEFIEVRE